MTALILHIGRALAPKGWVALGVLAAFRIFGALLCAWGR
jgi:hypothetical protein